MREKKPKIHKKGPQSPKINIKRSDAEISEKDLDKVAGGAPRDPQSGLATG